MWKPVVNVGIRLTSLLGKFYFLIWLSKSAAIETVGQYGMIASVAVFVTMLLGMEFYIFSNRELIRENCEREKLAILSRQFTLYLGIQVIGIPLALLVLTFQGWDSSYILLILTIMSLEHFSAELIRLLVSVERQLTSAVTLFIKSTLWVFPLIYFYKQVELLDVLRLWLGGVVIATAFGLVMFIRQFGYKWMKVTFDKTWFIKGRKVCLIYFISSASVIGLTVIDKVFVDSNLGPEALSVYVLYIGIANALVSLFDAGVAVYLYPRLIACASKGYMKDWVKRTRDCFVLSLIMISSFIVFVNILSDYLFDYLDKPNYKQFENCLYTLIVALGFKILSSIYQYSFYSVGEDLKVLTTNLLPILMFTILILIFGATSLQHISVLLLISYITQFVVRGFIYISVKGKYCVS